MQNFYSNNKKEMKEHEFLQKIINIIKNPQLREV